MQLERKLSSLVAAIANYENERNSSPVYLLIENYIHRQSRGKY